MSARIRHLLPLLAIVAAGCAGNDLDTGLGTGLAACDLEFSEAGTATIMQAQAVPSAAWGPCVVDLAPGWELHNTEPRRGSAGFTLDSDRIGVGFLSVELMPACDPPDGAVPGLPPNDEIQRLVLERETTAPLPITVVASASRHVEAAFQIAKELLGTRVDGHSISVHTASGTDAAGAVTAALERGRFALVVDDETLTRGILELRDPAAPRQPELDDLDDLLEDIADSVGAPTYDATWWHLGEGACIVFEFDARGPGAEAIAERVRTSVGFYPLDDLRVYAAERGLVYGELP